MSSNSGKSGKSATAQSRSFSESYVLWAQRLLPMPFTIAVILTLLTMVLAILIAPASEDEQSRGAVIDVLQAWKTGLWNSGGMVFTMQMILILVLGHVLALARPVQWMIDQALRWCKDTSTSAATVALLTIVMAYLNWGLGLVFGAIFARKVGEQARRLQFDINYPLVGAAGYVGLMVWHGGISGSAPVTVNSPAHNLVETTGVIALGETIGSSMNLFYAVPLTLILIPAVLYWLGKRVPSRPFQLSVLEDKEEVSHEQQWAEKLDYGWILPVLLGVLMLWLCVDDILRTPPADRSLLRFLTLNWINLALFGTALLVHGSFHSFIRALDEAIRGASGIAIQFPLYFGIMGIMTSSGLLGMVADFFVSISNTATFPLLTFLSAGIVNVFVPSGGGQWQVQGPIVIDAARQLGVSDWKTVMALSYGDQLTNMLQPFWALPLLGITGLKAKEILPYTLLMMAVGMVIFASALLLF